MDNLFNTISSFFTIFNIFKKIVTVILFFAYSFNRWFNLFLQSLNLE